MGDHVQTHTFCVSHSPPLSCRPHETHTHQVTLELPTGKDSAEALRQKSRPTIKERKKSHSSYFFKTTDLSPSIKSNFVREKNEGKEA